jgi:hypothetical protein
MVVKMKIKSGGGLNSNKTVQSKQRKSEPVSHKGNVAGVAQQGLALQFKRQPITSGKGYEPPKGIAPNTQVGPGAGRTIHRSGSQSATPPAKPMPEGRNILAEYGPEVPGKRGI